MNRHAVCVTCNDPIERIPVAVAVDPSGWVTARTWVHLVEADPYFHADHPAEPFTPRHLALIEAGWPDEE